MRAKGEEKKVTQVRIGCSFTILSLSMLGDSIFESTWDSKLGLLMLKFKSYPLKIIINKFHIIL